MCRRGARRRSIRWNRCERTSVRRSTSALHAASSPVSCVFDGDELLVVELVRLLGGSACTSYNSSLSAVAQHEFVPLVARHPGVLQMREDGRLPLLFLGQRLAGGEQGVTAPAEIPGRRIDAQQVAQRRHEVVGAHDLGAHALRRHAQRPTPDQRRRDRLLVHVDRVRRLAGIPEPVVAQQRAAGRSEDHERLVARACAARASRAATAPRRPSRSRAAAYLRRLPMVSASSSFPERAFGAAGSGLKVSNFVCAYRSRYFCATPSYGGRGLRQVHGGEERLARRGGVDDARGAGAVRRRRCRCSRPA